LTLLVVTAILPVTDDENDGSVSINDFSLSCFQILNCGYYLSNTRHSFVFTATAAATRFPLQLGNIFMIA